MFVISVAAWFPGGATLFQSCIRWPQLLTEPDLRISRIRLFTDRATSPFRPEGMHPIYIVINEAANNTFQPDVKGEEKNLFTGHTTFQYNKGFPSAITETPLQGVISSTNSSTGPPRQSLP